MAPSRNVKITLYLIPLDTPKNPTRILHHAPLHPWRLLELPRSPPHFSENMFDVRIFLLQLFSPVFPLITTAPESMHPLLIDPRAPLCRVAVQHFTGDNPIAARVLDVDVEVLAFHGDDGVQVDLQGVGDSLLNAELLRFVAAIPAAELGEG